ncbi:LysE family translocator [Pontibaca salina]|uniref:LysE family translocator n=1 Tax=Pontibaca salina TaxID=2795731 RepID=A0A934LY33_9RHOB|nr:LysE family translocator [Pontibaca salina]MBI6629322.1 LysE family translocator [Pontibaca salina]
MVDPLILLAFAPAALAMNLTPGADMMFCLGQGLRAGPPAALAASAGVSAGVMAHVVLAGVGLGALVAALPWLFDAIRWIGVFYLLWLAWGAFRGVRAEGTISDTGTGRAFRTGFLVNLTNPKIILFVLAFVPQFIVPGAGPIWAQFLIFGAVLSLGGLVINGLVGLFAGRARRRLVGNPRVARYLGYASGTIFTALAIRLAILERT